MTSDAIHDAGCRCSRCNLARVQSIVDELDDPGTGARYQFPSARIEDPDRALADLAATPALVDDIAALVNDLIRLVDDPERAAQWGIPTLRELGNLRRRLESIHARLTT